MKPINNKVIRELLAEDKKIFVYISGYAIFISILYLGLPLSTQLIINRIKHTALIQPVLIISIILIILLSMAGILSVLQKYLLEMYKRQSFVRITSKLFIKTAYTSKKNIAQELSNDLSGKYFEIFNIQSNMSVLAIEGLLVILQIIVGFIISSFYHPYILVINIITLIVIYITWKIFFNSAVDASIKRSQKKYNVYSWFDTLLNNTDELKNNQFRGYTMQKSHSLIAEYITARVKYWKIILLQTIIFVVLSSVVILAIFSIGSFLVIYGQLTLGQLVASEIIFISSIFSIGKLSSYFDRYYELVASIDKINYLLDLDENSAKQNQIKSSDNSALIQYNNVRILVNHDDYFEFNLAITPKSLQTIDVKNEQEAMTLLELIRYNRYLHNKILHLNQLEYLDDQVVMIDNLQVMTEPLVCYLISSIDTTANDYSTLENIFERFKLNHLINTLDHGLDTIIANKYQLSHRATILIKLIRAILSNSKIIVIGGLVNILENTDLDQIDSLCQEFNKNLVIVNYKKIQ